MNIGLRLVVLILAGLSDCFDGFLARRFNETSRVGAVLDPLMDKFFMFLAIGVLMTEGSLSLWEGLAMFSRDLFLLLFALYLGVCGKWRRYRPTALFWGKASTVFQYLALFLAITFVPLPPLVFGIFPLFGLLYFVELLAYHSQLE